MYLFIIISYLFSGGQYFQHHLLRSPQRSHSQLQRVDGESSQWAPSACSASDSLIPSSAHLSVSFVPRLLTWFLRCPHLTSYWHSFPFSLLLSYFLLFSLFSSLSVSYILLFSFFFCSFLFLPYFSFCFLLISFSFCLSVSLSVSYLPSILFYCLCFS